MTPTLSSYSHSSGLRRRFRLFSSNKPPLSCSVASPSSVHVSPQNKRIPQGTVYGEIPLEAVKAYPIKLWQNTGLEPRIAYADRNTHGESNTLSVKLLPDGGKTAPHPQIVFYVNGPYHVETLSYFKSNIWNWTTWLELHLDATNLKQLIDAVIKTEIALEAL